MTTPNPARDLVLSCFGKHGIWADNDRYRYQCWTRDLSLAMAPAALLLGRGDLVRTHLHSLARRQGKDGAIPILFLDGIRGHAHFVIEKARKWAQTGRASFMLTRYLSGDLGRLTPGTKDSELHFARAVYDYAHDDPVLVHAADRAITYMEKHVLSVDGLVQGADWRDTMDSELSMTPVLSNNAIWFWILNVRREHARAQIVREALARRTCGLLGDYAGNKFPDPLGLALGVINGLILPPRYWDVMDLLHSVMTPIGPAIKCKHNPRNEEEAQVIDRTQGVVVWPFVVGYVRRALNKIEACGHVKLNVKVHAQIMRRELDQIRDMVKHLDPDHGLAEWYDPETGKGYGSKCQGWSAALDVITDEGTP